MLFVVERGIYNEWLFYRFNFLNKCMKIFLFEINFCVMKVVMVIMVRCLLLSFLVCMFFFLVGLEGRRFKGLKFKLLGL